MSRKSTRSFTGLVFALTLFLLWACDLNGVSAELGRDALAGASAPIPGGVVPGTPPLPPTAGGPVVGESCRSESTRKLCLALKYIVYVDSVGKSVLSQDTAIANIRAINNVWSQCDIGFQIEEFSEVDPLDFKLQFRTANYPELDDIRNAFADDSMLLVTTTGQWNRTGSLGNTGANAWTAMPGGPPYGAVLEKSVGAYSMIIAHELGHYLNLNHVKTSAELMNPIIYQHSTKISEADCNKARSAARYFWSNMLR